METKFRIARKVADEGIAVIIANGTRQNILEHLILGDGSVPCTLFAPSSHPVSSVKKWIAHSEDFAKGEIHINVRIVSPDGNAFAVGRTSYDSEEARGAMGKQGQKPIIHYDYLCIE